MSRTRTLATIFTLTAGGVLLVCGESAPRAFPGGGQGVRVSIDRARPAAETDARFLSFAIDTAQVVGGEFWAPPGQGRGLLKTHAVGRYDFERPRLRRLAAALAPAYLRIGGTDADRTVYQLDDRPVPAAAGARWVLTRERWDQVNQFARALDLRVVFTLNAGPSARDGRGDWDPTNARALIAYSRDRGHPVDVWELGNEVNAFPLLHRRWLSADRYAGDLGRARALLRELGSPARLAGPSSAFWPILGEGRAFTGPLLAKAGPLLDIVSWHYYPQQSHRCPLATRRARPGQLLSPAALADVESWAGRVEEMARAGAPQAALWLGETGGAQCGGEPGLTDAFADVLWWLDELGRLSRRGHAVVVRQTLSGSDYGLIDDRTLEPNPSYWASWLWRNTMGRRALNAAGDWRAPGLRVYAHCAADGATGEAGAVTALLVNLDAHAVEADLTALGGAASDGMAVLRLTADQLGSRTVRLNGDPLHAAADGTPPALAAWLAPQTGATSVTLAPHSVAFVVLPHAAATACL